MEYIIAGSAFSQLESAVEESSHGEVVVSPEVWNHIGEKCVGEKTEKNWRITSMLTGLDVVSSPKSPGSVVGASFSSYIQVNSCAMLTLSALCC